MVGAEHKGRVALDQRATRAQAQLQSRDDYVRRRAAAITRMSASTRQKPGSAGDVASEPRLKVTTRDRGGEVEPRIRDNGGGYCPGASRQAAPAVLYDQADRRGTGLGRSISYGIVTSSITARSRSTAS